MKLRNLLGLLACGSLMLTACSEDELANIEENVPQNVQDTFHKMYEDVKDVKWENVKGYHVARFNAPIQTRTAGTAYASAAWFNNQGDYCQADEIVAFDELPAMVQEGFIAYKTVNYPDWTIDECKLLARNEMGLIYVIEIESGNDEREISLSEYGDILKDVLDDDDEDEILPVDIPEEVIAFLKDLYLENFDLISIVEYEAEDDEIELDILEENGRHKEFTLSTDFQLICTEYDATMEELTALIAPEVMNQLVALALEAGFDINDPQVQKDMEIEVKDHVTEGISIEIEIETEDAEFEISIDKDGNIVAEEDED